MNMLQFKALFRIQLQAALNKFAISGGRIKNGQAGSGKASKKKKVPITSAVGTAILWTFLGALFTVFFGMMFYVLAEGFHAVGLGWLYMTVAFLGSAMLMLVGTVFLAKSQLFEAKDNNILLPMPIPTSVILLSRMLTLYLMNLVWGGIVMLPALVCRYLFAPFTVLSLVFSLLLFFTLGLFSLALSCLLGWLIAVISARIRNKTFVTVVLSLVFIGVYYYMCGIGMTNLMTLLLDQSALVADVLGAIAPLYWIGDAAANGNVLSFLGALLVFLFPFLAVYVLLSKTFLRTVTATHTAKREEYRQNAKKLHVRSVYTALLFRENARLLSSATYLLNAGIGLVFLTVGAVAVVWQRESLSVTTSLLGWDLVPAMMVGLSCAMLAMTIFTAPSVSLDGRTIPLLRALPLSPTEILRAKWHLHILWCAPPAFLFSTVGTLFFLFCQTEINPSVLSTPGVSPEELLAMLPTVTLSVFDRIIGIIAIFLLPQLFSAVTGGLGLLFGIRYANLHWTNEAQVVKQGTAVGLSMLCNMGLLAVCAASVWFGRGLLDASVWLLLWTVVFALLVFVVRRLVMGYGCRAFEELSV